MSQKDNCIGVVDESSLKNFDYTRKTTTDFNLTQSCRSLLSTTPIFSIEDYHILNFLKMKYSLNKDKKTILDFYKNDIEDYLMSVAGLPFEKVSQLFYHLESLGLNFLNIPKTYGTFDSNYHCIRSIIKSFKYSTYSTTIQIELDDSAHLFFGIDNEAGPLCNVDLNIVKQIKNKETVRMYELYLAYRALNSNNCDNLAFTIEIDHFKELIGLPDSIYKRPSDLKRRIISPALETLANFDINLNSTFLRDDEKRTYIEFSSMNK